MLDIWPQCVCVSWDFLRLVSRTAVCLFICTSTFPNRHNVPGRLSESSVHWREQLINPHELTDYIKSYTKPFCRPLCVSLSCSLYLLSSLGLSWCLSLRLRAWLLNNKADSVFSSIIPIPRSSQRETTVLVFVHASTRNPVAPPQKKKKPQHAFSR